MYVLAIDPGVMNLALAVIEIKRPFPPTTGFTLASLCAHTRLAYWNRIDLSGGVKNATHTQLCKNLIVEFDKMTHLLHRVNAVGIEHQMTSNHDANAVQNYALSYFMCRYPNVHVQLIRPVWKTQYLSTLSNESGVPKFDLNKYEQRKKWSVCTISRCRELWKELPEDLYDEDRHWLYRPLTWIKWEEARPKQDDLADSAIMIFGWIVHTKGELIPTAPTRKKGVAMIKKPPSTQSLIKDVQRTRSQQVKLDTAFVSAGTGSIPNDRPASMNIQKTKTRTRYRGRKLVRM